MIPDDLFTPYGPLFYGVDGLEWDPRFGAAPLGDLTEWALAS